MSYKTILVHVSNDPRTSHVIDLGARLALADNAHLVGVASTGIDQLVYQYSGVALGMALGVDDFSRLTEGAERALSDFESQVQRLGVTSYERRRIDEEAGAGLARQSRYCDLLVIGQPYPDQASTGLPANLPQNIMLRGARPVLVVPHRGRFDHVGRNAVIAWDGSMEATRAITAALPMLRRAGKATLAVFNADLRGADHGEEPGADMALFLARHGVRIEVEQRFTALDIGEALLSMTAELGADLLVMGCYGHSRLREMVLGGATRSVLADMTLPVLMSH
jgi:nucleotide-binding universal stress UspA family protein